MKRMIKKKKNNKNNNFPMKRMKVKNNKKKQVKLKSITHFNNPQAIAIKNQNIQKYKLKMNKYIKLVNISLHQKCKKKKMR